MTATVLRPFNDSGYEILDGDIGRGEVVIWSVQPLTPRVGDVFLIESRGRTYDVAVETLSLLKGGWSATCRVEGRAL
jgi:hypothetical protein